MVSVCMATYNGSCFIKEQLESIVSQILPDDEIIISDDGSTDGTLDIIDGFHDKRIKVLRHNKLKAKYSFDYTTHNFENAIENCNGDLIFLADQDDIWLPEKYSVMKNALTQYDIVLSDCKIVNTNLEVIQGSKIDAKTITPKIAKNLKSNLHVGCCMAFKRKVLDIVLPFPKYGVAQDFWIAVLGGIYYSVGYVDKPLLLYRRHEGNVSETAKKSNNSLMIKVGYRCRMVKELLHRAGLWNFLRNL